MVTVSHRNVCLTCVIFALCHVVGVTAIEVATTVPRKIYDILKNTEDEDVKEALNQTRRILGGTEATDKRPYMVYLRLPLSSPLYKDYRRWLCGGVIIHEEFILTSAACIEDVKHFYVVSGTYKYDAQDDRLNNMCLKNGAKKAVWKCVPKNYVFDGHENDNIRWMTNDIAVVKVEDEFDFSRRIRGCDFVPKPICYNNRTAQLEQPGTPASIAGWGTTDAYYDVASRRSNDAQELLEADVEILSKQRCKKRWGHRYYEIIENYMICTKDNVGDLSEICSEKYVDCKHIYYSDESEEENRRVLDPEKLFVHGAHHNTSGRRTVGGFCENDHGGPLVYGTGVDSVVIGIISACLVKERTNKCYGPFLYTSIYKNKVLINCAIYKDQQQGCNKLFRAGGSHIETDFSWADHPDGPSKSDIKKMRRFQEEIKNKTTLTNVTENTNVSHTTAVQTEDRKLS